MEVIKTVWLVEPQSLLKKDESLMASVKLDSALSDMPMNNST